MPSLPRRRSGIAARGVFDLCSALFVLSRWLIGSLRKLVPTIFRGSGCLPLLHVYWRVQLVRKHIRWNGVQERVASPNSTTQCLYTSLDYVLTAQFSYPGNGLRCVNNPKRVTRGDPENNPDQNSGAAYRLRFCSFQTVGHGPPSLDSLLAAHYSQLTSSAAENHLSVFNR
jgi:hypothetical protein